MLKFSFKERIYMKILEKNIEDNGSKEVELNIDNTIISNEENKTNQSVIEAEVYRRFFDKYYD